MPLSSLELVEEIIYGDSLRLLEGSDETQLDTKIEEYFFKIELGLI